MKLLMSDYQVTLVNNRMSEFFVKFHGPAETPFASGVWKIHVELPEQFPYKSPSIGFMNKIFHPNIDELGSVCLDVINQTWSPMFELINIFEIFLPQLLRYPNPADPLNGEAAALLLRDPKAYAHKVQAYVERYASNEDADQAGDGDDDDDEMPMSKKSKTRPSAGAGANVAAAANGANGPAASNANGHAANGHRNGHTDDLANGEIDDDDEDKMSDMGELSDGDEFMGEMDD